MAGIVIEELRIRDGEQVIRAETIWKAFGSSYYRMTPQLKINVNLVEGDMNKIVDMMYDCFLYLQSEKEKIDQIVHQLLTLTSTTILLTEKVLDVMCWYNVKLKC